jgi:hypothetical protein
VGQPQRTLLMVSTSSRKKMEDINEECLNGNHSLSLFLKRTYFLPRCVNRPGPVIDPPAHWSMPGRVSTIPSSSWGGRFCPARSTLQRLHGPGQQHNPFLQMMVPIGKSLINARKLEHNSWSSMLQSTVSPSSQKTLSMQLDALLKTFGRLL